MAQSSCNANIGEVRLRQVRKIKVIDGIPVCSSCGRILEFDFCEENLRLDSLLNPFGAVLVCDNDRCELFRVALGSGIDGLDELVHQNASLFRSRTVDFGGVVVGFE